MTRKLSTFFMFEGTANQALNFYQATFDTFKTIKVDRYDTDGPGTPGSIKHASFTIDGQNYMASDSPTSHDFTFTPSISIFIDCTDEAEIVRLSDALSSDGKTLMPLDNYGFSKKFCWVEDKFGVSWQLNLA